MADSAITNATFSAVTKNDLDLDTTDSVQFAKIGIGVAADATRLFLASGDVSGGIATINRTNASTNAAVGTVIIKGTSSGDMVDGFGSAFQFAIQDTAGVENLIANIQGIRSGADNSGALVFATYNAGTPSVGMTINESQSVIVYERLIPDANDGAALGTSSLQFSDLFLAEGGVINFDNGDITLTQSGNTLTLGGGTLILPAGTTTEAPLKFTTGGSLLTTAEDGAIEMDDDCFYGTTDAGNRGYIPVRHFIRADSSRSLPNDTNENAIFNDPSNGRLTLETGTYLVEGIISVSGMSATSGNASIDLLGAGTATCGTWLWSASGRDNNSATAAASVTGSFSISQQSAASIVTAGTGTGLQITIQGTFEVTSAGTIIPSIDLVTASAATLAAGSYLVFERIGSTSVVSVGQWD